jgi:hypothetical protein
MSEIRECPTHMFEDVNGRPLEAMPEIQDRPPPTLKTPMEGPLGGGAGGLGAPTTYLEDIDGGTLGGDPKDLGAPTSYVKDVDGGVPWEVWTPFMVQRCAVVMNSTCIHLRTRGLNIYMYRRGRIYKEPLKEIQ